MKILLIYPPQSAEAIAPSNFEPLALEILASTIPDHYVKIFDMRFENLSSLKYELNFGTPDVVGLSVNNTIQVNQALKLLDFIKKQDSRIKTIVGGIHVTLSPHDFFCPTVDTIFLGWAERSFPQYIASPESSEFNLIPGVLFIKNGQPIEHIKQFYDLTSDEIPIPNRSLTKKYRNEIGRKTALVSTARGCPYRCIFCACWKAANDITLFEKQSIFLKNCSYYLKIFPKYFLQMIILFMTLSVPIN